MNPDSGLAGSTDSPEFSNKTSWGVGAGSEEKDGLSCLWKGSKTL